MNFEQLKKGAARIVNLLDSAGEFQDNKDITESQTGDMINFAYREDVFPRLQNQYKSYFEQEAIGPNYTTTATVDASSTSSTLVVTTNIFTESMVGQYVENYTDGVYAKIEGYTSATTVTLDTEIGDTWDGDTIRVLNRVHLLSSQADDAYVVTSIFVRYGSAGDYIRTDPGTRGDIFQTGYETFDQLSPRSFPTNLETSSGTVQGFSVYPLFTRSDDSAIKITYTEIPEKLTSGTDIPRLPMGHHEFLKWYAVYEIATQRGDYTLADRAMGEYERGKRNLMSSYRPWSADKPVQMKLPRRYDLMRTRTI